MNRAEQMPGGRGCGAVDAEARFGLRAVLPRAARMCVRWAVCALAALALATPCFAQTKVILVPADQPTIQAGIDAANPGDEVFVSPGTYRENIDFKGKQITVSSGGQSYSDPLTRSTIIDGGGKGPTVSIHSGETGFTFLLGFTIRNGLATGSAAAPSGGGVWIENSSPELYWDVIEGNQGCGVGISQAGYVFLQGDDIKGNYPGASANGCGAGGDGAGVVILSGILTALSGNVIEGNTSNGCGGGVVVLTEGRSQIQENIIRNNQAACGAGMSVGVGGEVQIVENLVYGNTTTVSGSSKGAGLAINAQPAAPNTSASLLMLSNTVFGNSGAAPASLATAGEQVEIDGEFSNASVVANNLFISANDQEALDCGVGQQPLLNVENNDVFNLTGQAYQTNCVAGGLGSGGLAVDPLFVDPSGTTPDLHLQASSPVIGAGNDAPDANYGLQLDFDIKPRTRNGKIDMGAYEYQGATTGKTATTSLLTASPSTVNYGRAVTFAVTVSGAGGTPTGTAQFFDGPTSLGTKTLSGGAASLSASTLSVGSHSVTAQYSGDGTFAASTSNTVQVVVNGDATTATLNAVPNPDHSFQPLTLTAMMTSAAGTPAGTVNFLSGTGTPVMLGSATLSGSGVATLTTSVLGAGTYTLTAVYAANGNFSGTTSNAVTETVLAEDTATSLTGSPNPAFVGQTVTFTATVTPVNPGGTPTGTVTFRDGGALLGGSAVGAGGVATYSTAALAAGTHSITATYGGSKDFNGSISGTFSEVIAQIGTTTTLASSLNPSYVGQAITFTATVGSSLPGTVPTGTVAFSDGAAALGTGTLSASGVATLATSTLAVGTHSIVATYSGQAGLGPSASQPLQQAVNPLDFTLAINPGTLTLKTQNHGVIAVTVTPGAGFTGAVQLSCGALPPDASCTFSSATLTAAGTTALSSQLTVDTSALLDYGQLQASSGGGLLPGRSTLMASLLPLGLGGSLAIFARRRKLAGPLRWTSTLIFAAILAAAIGCVVGCSGKLPGSTPPGTYAIPVVATGANGARHAVNLTLIVTP